MFYIRSQSAYIIANRLKSLWMVHEVIKLTSFTIRAKQVAGAAADAFEFRVTYKDQNTRVVFSVLYT